MKKEVFCLKTPGRKKVLYMLLFIFSAAVRVCFGQLWATHHYTEIDGLPTSFVYDIKQDPWGRIWLATRNGITCYDGVAWKNYTEADGLPHSSFIKICIGRQGQVWALPEPAQSKELPVGFLDGNRWQAIENLTGEFPNSNIITAFQLLEQDERTVLLVGTTNAGVYIWEKGKWQRSTVKEGLLSDCVNGIAVVKEKCYVATANGLSLIRSDLTIDNGLNDAMILPAKEIKGIAVEDRAEYPRIWFVGNGFAGYFTENDYKITNFNTGIKFNRTDEAIKILPDCRSGAYIANIFELFYFNYRTRKTELLSVTNGLLGVGTNTMFIDFEKNIWISCDRGVTKIASRRFSSLNLVHGLLEDEVTAVFEYEPGKFVLGHNNGITYYDGSRFLKLPLIRFSGTQPMLCRVLDIKADTKKNIWVASSFMGLARINRQMKIEWFGREHGLGEKITSIWIDARDNVWIGTTEGIFYLSQDRQVLKKISEFPAVNTRKIFGQKGKLHYIAAHNTGIYIYEENRWKNYRSAGDPLANGVYAVHNDSRRRLLVGTAAGLYILEEETLIKFKSGDFELNRPVYFIVEDYQRRLWFGTGNGVVRWDGSKDITYSIPEGLIGPETNRAAGIVDSRGRIWIGTNRGVSIYEEAFDNYNSWNPPPKLRLLYIEADDREIPANRPIKLNYNTRSLIFHFSGISFYDEKALHFKHKLEGFNKDWSKEQYHYYRSVEYSNLKPGTYRFYLKAKNALGVWSDIVKSPAVIVLEPFYNNWWFILSIILLSGFIFYTLFYFISMKRNAALLEKLVLERTGQLQATEKRYRELFEDSRDMVFISSKEGRILDINPAGVILLGYETREEVMAVSIDTDIYVDQTDRVIFLNEIHSKGYVKDYELNLKRKDGERMTALLTASIVTDKQGEIEAIRGTIRDITEKKKLQQQLEQSQKMEAIGTLAGGIAHDFNNILGIMTGALELAINELPKNAKARRNIEHVMVSTNRAKDLVKQILMFSRQAPQKQSPLRIGPLIKESLKLLRSTLPSTIEIRRHIEAENSIVLADPTQIHQVMMNLCTNAAHAMRDKGGVLQVNLQEMQLGEEAVAAYNDIAPGRYLRLSVGDTGHGIAPAIMKRIFEPYFTTKLPGEGTGMGLAVIHGLVKRLGGEITVYSEPGQGTTFHVLLPIAKGAVESPAVETSEELEDIPLGKNEHILLVDDEPLLAVVLKRVLSSIGYQAAYSTSSSEALEIFRAAPAGFDLVITDLTMPQMNGIQLAKELKKIRPDIPIILCTGFGETLTREQIKKLGIRKLLLKPIDRRSLAIAVREQLAVNPGG